MPTEQLERMLATARSEYRAMVLAMCEGESFPDVHLRETTLAAGFSMSDLERHLGTAKGRRYWAITQRELANELGEKHRVAQAEADRLGAELDRLEREYQAAVAPLLARHRKAVDEARRWGAQERELSAAIPAELHSTLPPGWRAGLQALELKLEEVHRRLPPLLKRRGELQAKLKGGKSLQYRLESAESEHARAKAESELAAHKHVEQEFEVVDAEYKSVQAEAQRLQAEIRRYSQTAMDWKMIAFDTREEAEARRSEAERRERGWREGHHFVEQQVVGG